MEINMEYHVMYKAEMEEYADGLDWNDICSDADYVMDAGKSVKEGFVAGITWVGRKIRNIFH